MRGRPVRQAGRLGYRGCMTEGERIDAAIELAVRYGGIDGDHHKMWVIDQMVRALAGDRYEQIVTDAKAGDEGPDSYRWDVGIAP